MVESLTEKADGKECGANNDMEAMKACGYKECGTINPVCDSKGGFVVFHSLEEGEVESEENGEC